MRTIPSLRFLGAIVALGPLLVLACSKDEDTTSDASVRGDGSATLPDREIPLDPPDARADASDAERDPCAPAGPPVCPPNRTFLAGAAVAGLAGRFLSITPDELHVAVMETDDGGATVKVADRASTSAAFPAPTAFPFPVDPTGASLATDGLALVVTQSANTRRAPRAAIGQPFGAPATEGFGFGGEGQTFRAPVALAHGGFFLTRVGAFPGQLAFTEITKNPTGYEQAVVTLQAELLSTGDKVRMPTGMSIDLRTLFFYDEETSETKVAHRPAQGCAYSGFATLGNRPAAQPNATCTALYYADPTTGATMRAEAAP